MDENLIESIWQRDSEEPEMSYEQIAAALQPRVERSSRILYQYVWLHLLVQMATLVLAGANLVGYRHNPTMLMVEGAICALSLGGACYGIWLFGEVRRLDRLDGTLARTVQHWLDFYRSSYRLWPWIAALSTVLLAFALNSLIDNIDGHFAINKPVVFFGTQIAMVAILVAAFRMAHAPYVRELEAVLADLRDQLLDRTRAADAVRARSRRWIAVIAVALALLFALGLWLALRGVG